METNNSHKYDVFVSYSRSDYDKSDPNNLIGKIIKLFDENNISYFFDQSEVTPGDNYATVITEAILDSETFLFISTENSNSSIWTKKEIALAHHYKKSIVPVRADESFYNSAVAFFLADIDYINGSDHNYAIEKLTKGIVNPIRQKAEAKRLEAKKKKEIELKEKAKKEKEQEQLITSIRLDIAQLESDEKSMDIKRDKIKLQINKVENEEKKAELSSLLTQTYTDIKSLESKVDTLESIIRDNNQTISEKERIIQEQDSIIQDKDRQIKKNESCTTQPSSLEFDIRKYSKEHSLMTNIIISFAALVLLCLPIYVKYDYFSTIPSKAALINDLGFYDNIGDKLQSYIYVLYAESLIACGIIAIYILSLMFRKFRINLLIHTGIISVLFILLCIGEEYIRIRAASTNAKILIMIITYLIAISSFYIKNKKTGTNSMHDLKYETFFGFFNPKKHIEIVVVAFLILFTFCSFF